MYNSMAILFASLILILSLGISSYLLYKKRFNPVSTFLTIKNKIIKKQQIIERIMKFNYQTDKMVC